MPDFTLPHHQNVPSKAAKHSLDALVAFSVAVQLFSPEFRTRGRFCGVSAARMLVPEASVNKDDLSPSGENEIRFSRKVFSVKSEPIPQTVRQGSDDYLRFGHSPGSCTPIAPRSVRRLDQLRYMWVR